MPKLITLLYPFFSVNSPMILGRFYLRNFKAVSGEPLQRIMKSADWT